MKKGRTKGETRITIELKEFSTDKVTTTMDFFNEMAIAFCNAYELCRMRGLPALAERYRRRCDQITEVLESRGLYDDLDDNTI